MLNRIQPIARKIYIILSFVELLLVEYWEDSGFFDFFVTICYKM